MDVSTWLLGDNIIDDFGHTNYVCIYNLNGRLIRCIVPLYENSSPIGVIYNIDGYGDWIYFDSVFSVSTNSMTPRVLNRWSSYTADTEQETEHMRTILLNAKNQAKRLMYCINGQEFCKTNH